MITHNVCFLWRTVENYPVIITEYSSLINLQMAEKTFRCTLNRLSDKNPAKGRVAMSEY